MDDQRTLKGLAYEKLWEEGEDQTGQDELFGRAPRPPQVRPSSLLVVRTWEPLEGKSYLTFASCGHDDWGGRPDPQYLRLA